MERQRRHGTPRWTVKGWKGKKTGAASRAQPGRSIRPCMVLSMASHLPLARAAENCPGQAQRKLFSPVTRQERNRDFRRSYYPGSGHRRRLCRFNLTIIYVAGKRWESPRGSLLLHPPGPTSDACPRPDPPPSSSTLSRDVTFVSLSLSIRTEQIAQWTWSTT